MNHALWEEEAWDAYDRTFISFTHKALLTQTQGQEAAQAHSEIAQRDLQSSNPLEDPTKEIEKHKSPTDGKPEFATKKPPRRTNDDVERGKQLQPSTDIGPLS